MKIKLHVKSCFFPFLFFFYFSRFWRGYVVGHRIIGTASNKSMICKIGVGIWNTSSSSSSRVVGEVVKGRR